MKMLITLKPGCAFGSNFEYFFLLNTYVLKHCPATGMKKCDEASPSISLAGRPLLVNLLITLELDGIFGSIFVY